MVGVSLRRFCALWGLVLLAPTGCDTGPAGEIAADEDEGDGASPRDVEPNTFRLNTFRLNTFRLNTFRLNTFRLNGDEGTDDYIEIVDVSLQGNKLAEDAWLGGSKLNLLDKHGDLVDDTKLKHVTILFQMTDSAVGAVETQREVALRSVTPLAPNSDVWLYSVDVRDSGGSWEPLCVDADGNATEAILIGYGWNPATGSRLAYLDGTVTFACRGAALAKCVEWGYRPWANVAGGSLLEYHQACTRMVRADYCGDGVAHTLTGTPIHVLDPLGIQTVDPNFTYAVEAEWGPNGAVCLNAASVRHPEFSIGCEIPSCGASFTSGGLIQSGKILSGP